MNDGVASTNLDLLERCVVGALLHYLLSRRNADAPSRVIVTVRIYRRFSKDAVVDHWGENFPLCDIGPTPLGDGTVDVQDLIALSGHLFETVTLPASPASYGSFTEGPVGTYTMTDRGGDIWGSSDQLHFAYKTLTGPGSIVARVDSLTNTDPWAKAGVMIRETLDRSSKHALVCVTAGNGVAFQSRSKTQGNSIDTHPAEIQGPPA